MKTNLPGASIAAALICLAPLPALAQNIPSHPSVNGGLDRLTLLPGPYLLSPARTTPTMMPSPIKLGSAPSFAFVPGSVSAATQTSITAVPGETTAKEPFTPIPTTRPSPESLRFDAKLESPATPPKIEFRLRAAP